MPHPTTPCRTAFDKAEAFRRKIPLPSGQHKLREAASELAQIRATVNAVADSIRTPRDYRPGQLLGRCTMNDRAVWLKRLPTILAEKLGLKILPGIAALAGDGVPPDVVAHETREATEQAERLLARCEALHARLKRGIAPEYDALSRGDSELFALLDEVEDMVDWGLQVLEVHGEGSGYSPRPN
jgi:hypothetical protein